MDLYTYLELKNIYWLQIERLACAVESEVRNQTKPQAIPCRPQSET